MDEVFQKLWHYSQDQEVKGLITPKNKLTNLLDP
jgi:hypothetical protein